MNRLVIDPRMNPNFGFATLGLNPRPQPPPIVVPQATTPMPATLEEANEVVDLKYIIENKPKAKIVREYLKAQLASIKSEEDMIFEV